MTHSFLFGDLSVIRRGGAALLCFALFTLCLSLAGTGNAHAQTGAHVQDIRVTGTARIDPETVRAYMGVQRGEEINAETLDRATKALFRTGLFADIAMRERGGVIEVDVVENPIINEIAFEGNDKIKDTELLAEIQLKSRQVLTRTAVQSDVARIGQLYRRQGRFSAAVDPKIIRLDQNRVNLVFEITEGPLTKIRTIRFIGNKRFNDEQLQSVVSMRESRWYRLLGADDRYDPDRLAFDQELLRKFYLSRGYADFQVVSAVAELSQDKQNFHLTFTLDEGARYRVGALNIESGIRTLDGELLRKDVQLESGAWYDMSALQTTIDAMTDTLGEMQYAFVTIRPRVERDRANLLVNVTFEILESPRVFVERIDIQGNVRTLDKVIRREFQFVEGDPFVRSRLARSEQRIRDLDYFESVEIRTLPGSAPDKTRIEATVAEKSTGELSIGAGFSTADGPLADFRIRERNLLGRGQDLLLGVTIAGERSQFDVSFTEPYFLNRDLSAGIDAFHMTRDLQDEASFDQKRTGGGVRLGYPLSEKWRQLLRYRIERNEIRDVAANASLFVRDQEGRRVTSAISQRLTYEARDSRMMPTEGLHAWLDTEVAGLGGDSQYVSGKLGASWFYPVADNWVLNIMGEGGAIEGWGGEDVRINDRFFLGGSNLRGFESAGVGPRDIVSDDSLGGNLFYRGTVELSFPLGLPKELGVQGHGFSDFGSLWSLDSVSSADVIDEHAVRVSAGFGVSWRSPMGPIRMDFGFPLVDEDYDKDERFRFSFGTRF